MSTPTATPENEVKITRRSANVTNNTAFDAFNVDTAHLLSGKLQDLTRLIKEEYWQNLTRTIDVTNKALTSIDSKLPGSDPRPRLYVPSDASEQYHHYTQLATDHPEVRLEVQCLPKGNFTTNYIRSLNDKPGLLALALDKVTGPEGESKLEPLPYVVPGGRFNELYGWDTYFTVLGLLVDGFTSLSVSMLKHFCFCIQHYGKIFNANRTYYLGRSQPPFLSSMGREICERLSKTDPKTLELARMTISASIKEYKTVWTTGSHYDKDTGLSRYSGEGEGFPPEVEPHHFDTEIEPRAAKAQLSIEEFMDAYNNGEIQDAALEEYLKHDRACRESGHDTSYRFVGHAANLATVDLNSCLHKYEMDIAAMLDEHFHGSLEIDVGWTGSRASSTESAETWRQRASNRREAMHRYLWSEENGIFFDYDTITHEQMSYENATTFWPLWANVATPEQAQKLVEHALPKLEARGGLVASSEGSRGAISTTRPQRQWDYPYAWAPHQMLAWQGLRNYGFDIDAERLIFRWVSMVVRTFSDYNGLVVEKYDVTSKDESHVVEAEYGNQGSDFSSEVQAGFAWTNASVVYGAKMLREIGGHV